MVTQFVFRLNNSLGTGENGSLLASTIWKSVRENPTILLVILFTLYVLQITYYIFLHPLRDVPGPFLASFSKLWINIRHFRGSWHDDILEVHRQYGPVVRITPNEVSFVDREALNNLYGYSTGTRKTSWYGSWVTRDMQISLFGTQDVVEHKFMRGRITAAYSMASILPMEPFVQQVTDKCWAKFGKYAASGQHIDMGDWVNYYTFDVIGQLAMGGDLGFIEQGKDVDGLISSIHSGTSLTGNMGHVPLQMWWFFNRLSKWLIDNFGTAKLQAFPKFVKWLECIIADRMQDGLGDRRKDMLQHFIEMQSSQSSTTQPATKEDVLMESVIALAAGVDTTSYAILSVIGNLVSHPEIVPRLQQEVDQAYRDLGLVESGKEILYMDATKLPYLVAIITESMRLDPSFVYNMPRHTPDKGIQIGPHYLPKGTYAGVNPRAMNRAKDIFGEDADQFVPERWISKTSDDVDSIKEMTRLLTTFGMGSRVCIGKNIALIQVYKFAAQFVRHFELEAVNPNKPWTTKSATFAFRNDFWVKLKER